MCSGAQHLTRIVWLQHFFPLPAKYTFKGKQVAERNSLKFLASKVENGKSRWGNTMAKRRRYSDGQEKIAKERHS